MERGGLRINRRMTIFSLYLLPPPACGTSLRREAFQKALSWMGLKTKEAGGGLKLSGAGYSCALPYPLKPKSFRGSFFCPRNIKMTPCKIRSVFT
jgi:hypothetical protein